MRIIVKLSIILIILNAFSSLAQDINAQIFAHVNNKNWQAAEELAKSTKEQALLKLVLSQKFLDSNYSENNFAGIVQFIEKNPHWPQLCKLKKQAEQYLKNDTDPRLILRWFNKNKPKTGMGYKFYAIAAAKLIKDPIKLYLIIKSGWIFGDFTLAEEKEYLSKFGKYLHEEDHVRKIDEYLWAVNIQAAKELMYLVREGYRAAFLATIAIIQKSNNAEELFYKVPEKYYTSGLLFHYLKAKKKEVPNSKSIELFKKAKIDYHHSHEWSHLQMYYAREFIDQKDFISSYKIISRHFAIAEEDIREVEWLCGWLALSFLNKPELALNHFEQLLKIVKTPISLSRANYWLGRVYEAKGQKEKAKLHYKIASNYSHTFYGQLAHLELKQNKIILPTAPKTTLRHKQIIENNEVVRAAKLLVKYGKFELAQLYLKTVVEHTSPAELVWLAKVVKAYNNIYYTTNFSKYASQYHAFLIDYNFPIPYKISNSPVEAALAYGVIRQESLFDPKALSSAKAMGLMQLIKDTACRTAKAIAVPCDIPRLTRDPEYNIKLGTHQLNMLLKERKGSYILSLASYNTAACNVDKWLKRFGDPRELTTVREVIDWLELIPFHETRNYVQRVLENIQIYRIILNKDNIIRLKRDLVTNMSN